MARVPQDDGSERLIPEAEVLAGLRSGGAGPMQSVQLGFVPDFVPPALLGDARGSRGGRADAPAAQALRPQRRRGDPFLSMGRR